MLDLDVKTRHALWQRVGELVEGCTRGDPASLVPRADFAATIVADDFERPIDPRDLIERVAEAMHAGQVHTRDPRYFGLVNPAPAALGIIANALVAAFNPQLATRRHAPWAVEVEEHLLRSFGVRFGYVRDEVEGTFTTGGAEANETALLCALSSTFPDVAMRGLRKLDRDPTLYVSAEVHPTIAKAAAMVGLGTDAVREIPVDARLRMKTNALRDAIARDRAAGSNPFMIVATAGTTSAGVIDPLDEIANVAEKSGCWLHVDAAWGGLAALVPELANALHGIARADSISFDAHKALAAPMGAGLYLTRRRGALAAAFDVSRHRGRTAYMPRDTEGEPYARSKQWSRRFIGLEVFLALAAEGWDGYAASLRTQIALGERLRARLIETGWKVVNDTPLPLVCFVDQQRDDGASGRFLEAIARSVIAADAGWISLTHFSNGKRALRACIVHHRTTEPDVDRLVSALATARSQVE